MGLRGNGREVKSAEEREMSVVSRGEGEKSEGREGRKGRGLINGVRANVKS